MVNARPTERRSGGVSGEPEISGESEQTINR